MAGGACLSKIHVSKKIALAALLAAAFTVSHAAVITFDDAPQGDIANGYAGLDWSNFSVSGAIANSGYQNGIVSQSNAAYNPYAHAATISTTSADGFDLNDAYFTAAWNNGLQITANAVFVDNSTDSITFSVDESGPSDEFFGWAGLSSVTFSGSGGNLAEGVMGQGEHFVVDNLNVDVATAVPEPTNVGLMLAGLGLVGFAARRRKA